MTASIKTSKNLLSQDGECYYFQSFFDATESVRLFSELLTTTSWKQEPIVIFGKQVMQPRLTAWYGDSGTEYRYSGLTMVPNPWSRALLEMKARVEAHLGTRFNSALLNQYRDGQDSMGWHRDNEPELGAKPTIASLSFGEARVFQLRHISQVEGSKKLRVSVTLETGSLLLMSRDTQRFWYHSIPKTKKAIDPRINITFRNVQKTS